MNNGEKIRGMDNKKLAKLLSEYALCDTCQAARVGCYGDCAASLEAWLNQEVKK